MKYMAVSRWIKVRCDGSVRCSSDISSTAGTQQKSPAVRPKAGTLSWKEDLVRLEDRPSRPDELSYKDQTIYSYQQLSCLDSVIRSGPFALVLDVVSVTLFRGNYCQ